jgi:hypothetical protein
MKGTEKCVHKTKNKKGKKVGHHINFRIVRIPLSLLMGEGRGEGELQEVRPSVSAFWPLLSGGWVG